MKRLMILLTIMMTINLSGCQGLTEVASPDKDGNLTVSIAYDGQQDSVTGYVASEFGKVIEEKSNGLITANIYPQGQLGSDKDLLQSTISGDLEFVVQGHSTQVMNIAEATVLDMPYLFPNIEVARMALDDENFREIFEAPYIKEDLKVLMISDMGYRNTSSNKKLETLEDFEGLNIRTAESPVHIEVWKALGANPTPMNRGEVFLALQQGLLDAQEDPYINHLLNNYQEVQKYAISTSHLFHDVMLLTNNVFFENLPAEYQGWILEACEEVLVTSREYSDSVNNEQDLIDAGMEVIHLSDEVFNQISEIQQQQVWPIVRERAGDELVDALVHATNKAIEEYDSMNK